MKLKAAIVFLLALILTGLANSRVLSDDDLVCEGEKLVVFGDSLVAGYGLAPGEGFAEKLAESLAAQGYKTNLVNAGVSGDTTAGGLARLDWSLPEDATAVIVELGANDALRGVSPEITRKNLDEMLVRLKARNLEILLAGMLAPPNLGKNYGDAFNAIYPGLAKKHGVQFYRFFLDGVAGEPDLNQQDGIHPNSKGVAVLLERFLPAGIELMKRACAKRG